MDLPRPSLRIGAKHPYMRNEALHDIFNALRLTAMRIKLFMLAGLANNLRVLLSCRLTDLGRGYHTRHPLRSEEHTSELQSRGHLVCRLLLEKKKNKLYKVNNITKHH